MGTQFFSCVVHVKQAYMAATIIAGQCQCPSVVPR